MDIGIVRAKEPEQKIIMKKCGKKECANNVELQQNKYNYNSKFMFRTACGYRNKASSFPLYHFCSEECLEHFKKYSRCYQCDEDLVWNGGGTFVENLNYTLCNGRGDMEPPCVSSLESHKLEKRFAWEYNNMGYYMIDADIIDKLLPGSGCDKLKKLITDNGNKVSYSMLKDMYAFYTSYSARDRGDETNNETDKVNFHEFYDKIKDILE